MVRRAVRRTAFVFGKYVFPNVSTLFYNFYGLLRAADVTTGFNGVEGIVDGKGARSPRFVLSSRGQRTRAEKLSGKLWRTDGSRA